MSNSTTYADFGLRPPEKFNFGESYFARLQLSAAFLKAHPHRKDILESGVEQMMKICKSFPSLSFLRASKESFKPKLVHILKQIFFQDDKELCENDLISFYLQKENEFIVSLSHGNYCISLFGLLLLVKEFFEYVEHRAALEAFKRLEAESPLKDTLENLVFGDFKFKGFNFEYFITVKVFMARLLRSCGEAATLDLLRGRQLEEYLLRFHNFQAIKKLFCFKQDIETPKFILKNIRKYSIFGKAVPDFDPDIIEAGKSDIFSIDRLVMNLSNQNSSDRIQPELVSSIILSPSEVQQDQLTQLFSRRLFENPQIEKQCISLAKDHLRYFTYPSVEGNHRLSIFHKDFCIKRVQSLNPKQASFRLLFRILKTYNKKLVALEQLHINTRQNFQLFLRDFINKGCAIPEAKFLDQSEQVRKLNRRWNRVFEKAIDSTTENFVSLYTSFIFEESVRRYYVEESQEIYNEIKESLFVQNLSVSQKDSSPLNAERGVCVNGGEKVVVIELKKDKKAIQLTFFKGLKKKKEVQFKISKIDHEFKNIQLIDDASLTNLFAEFMPSCVLIIASTKESFYLKNKFGVLVNTTSGQQKPFESKPQAFVYLYNENLARTLCEAPVGSEGEGSCRDALNYNLLLQSPMLAMLMLFRREMLCEPNPLFKSGKRVFEEDFNIFVIKMVIKEFYFENGVLCSDLLNKSVGGTLRGIMGMAPKEEAEFKKASELYNKEDLFKSQNLCSNSKSMLAFLKLDGQTCETVDFNTMKIPTQKAHEYLSIINSLSSMSSSEIQALRESAYRLLYKTPSEDSNKDLQILEPVCGKEAFMTKVVYLKNAINDIFPRLNSKFQNVQKKSISLHFEEKVINSLFRTSNCNIRPGCIVEFTIRDIDLKMIRGKIGENFSGLLMLENIGSRTRANIHEGELVRFFSKNEVVRVVVKKVFPSMLRVDVSMADQDILNVRNYLSKFNVLKNFGLENNINFVIDNEKDVPSIPLYNRHERNFDFTELQHPHIRNLNFRDIKNMLRGGKKSDFMLKPSPRLAKSSLELIIFIQKPENFDTLPIRFESPSEPDSKGVISLVTEPETDPEKVVFAFEKYCFTGICDFIKSFVNMLIMNLSIVYSNENLTLFTKSQIIENMQKKYEKEASPTDSNTQAMIIESEGEPASNFFYSIKKSSFKLLNFKLFYKDKKGEINSKILKVSHEGFFFADHSYISLAFLLKELGSKRESEDFVHKLNDGNDSVESFLSEVVETTSNISIVSGDFAHRCEDESSRNKPNASGFQQRENQNANPDRNQGQSNGGFVNRGRDNFNRGRDMNSRGGNRDFGNRSDNRNKPTEGSSNTQNDTTPGWGKTGVSEAPVSDAFSQPGWGNANTESQVEVSAPNWGGDSNVTTNIVIQPEPKPIKAVESSGWNSTKPSNDQPGWGGAPANEIATWGEPSKNETSTWVATEINQAPVSTNATALDQNKSCWGQTGGSNDNGGSSWGQGNNGSSGNNDNRGFNNRGSSDRGNRDFSGNENRGSNRGFQGDNNNEGFRDRGGYNRSNENNNDSSHGGSWNTNRDSSTDRGYQGRERGDFRGDRGGFRGGDRGNNRGGDRGNDRGGYQRGDRGSDRSGYRGSDRGNFRGDRGRGERGSYRGRDNQQGNDNGNFNTNNNTSTFEAPAQSWGSNNKTSTRVEEQAPSWGNTTNTAETAPASWGQSVPNVEADTNWGQPAKPLPVQSPKNNFQANNPPSWGANSNVHKSPDRNKADSQGWGDKRSGDSNQKIQQSPAKNTILGNEPAPAQVTNNKDWGATNEPAKETNTGGWGSQTNDAPSNTNAWGNQNSTAPVNDRTSNWANKNSGERNPQGRSFDNNRGSNFERGGDRGGDRGNYRGRGRGFSSDNPDSNGYRPNNYRGGNDSSNNGFRGERGFNNRGNQEGGDWRGGRNDNRGRGRGDNRDFGGDGYTRGRGRGSGSDGLERNRGRGNNSGFNNNQSGFNSRNTESPYKNNQNDNRGFGGNSLCNNEAKSPGKQNSGWNNENTNAGWGNKSADKRPNESSNGGWGNAQADDKKANLNNSGFGTPKRDQNEPGKRGIDSFVAENSRPGNTGFSPNKRTKEQGERSNHSNRRPPSNQGSPRNPPPNTNNTSDQWGGSGWQ
jgi:hypothetical protein